MQLIKSTLFFILAFFAQFSIAQTQIPFNGSVPIEMKNYGNSYSWVPAQSGPGKGLTFSSNAGVSTVEPKLSGDLRLPYSNKAANSKLSLNIPIDPSKVSAKATQALKAGAKGLGYVGLASIACDLADCADAASALIAWGAEKLKVNPDGSISVVSPDPSADTEISKGYEFTANAVPGTVFYSGSSACKAVMNSNIFSGFFPNSSSFDGVVTCSLTGPLTNGTIITTTYTLNRRPSTVCTSGTPVVNGVCGGSATAETPLDQYFQSTYTGKGWDHYWAKMTAAIVASGGNVFTDGTSTDITGPAIVPVSTSETKTPVSLVPGTTTPAPSGHTGPTESGTQTTTTTTTAHNKFNPAPLTPGSSGSPASGPSMQTTQTTTTTTTITNNVTNITNIVNETTTEKDEAPEENATDTPLTGIPELYKQKYPDGLTGVFNDFKSRINTTSFVQLIGALTPNISGAGTCPSWTIDLTWTPGGSMGTHTIGQDFCWIWPILKIIVIVTTLFTVRRLIFGG